ncbi:unnamed protein product [Owenia fusiformis]|uniref:RING finger protein 17 n=1 Tax=Owenia fusiformis TaxID=6347 RepID=A0A8S4PYZ6_OWEFU|nr:unnamed protein product [Owenia fusiformis]CAH1798877.1 unnamed protein product [Owenia fusiformis]
MQKSPACPTCYNIFGAKDNRAQGNRTPLLLRCGHTFCEGCIVKLAKLKNNVVQCPTCQKDTPLKDGVNSLWPDIYVLGLLSINKRYSVDHELKLAPAGMIKVPQKKKPDNCQQSEIQPCTECNINSATCRCLKCDCIFCGVCFDRVHSHSKALQKHKAVSIGAEGAIMTEKFCSEHNDRPIEYFCEDDDSSICSHCVIVGAHKGHAISSMEEKNRLALDMLEPAMGIASAIHKRLKVSEKKLSSAIPDIRIEMSQLIDDVKTQFQMLHGALQAREVVLIDQIESIFMAETAPLEEMKVKLSEEIRDMSVTLGESYKALHNDKHVFMNANTILEKLNSVKTFPCHVMSTDDSQDIKLTFDDTLLKALESHGTIESDTNPRFKIVTLNEVPEEESEDNESEVADTADTESVMSGISGTSGAASAIIDDVIEDDTSDSSSATGSHIAHRKTLGKRPQKLLSFLRQELVYVTHIKNPCNFVIQRVADGDRLRSLSRLMNKWCESLEARGHIPNTVEPDDLVLAKYNADNNWYRARVKRLTTDPANMENYSSNMVEVYYVDYGNSETVAVSRLRTIQKKFLKVQELAVNCSLVDIVPPDKASNWSSEASEEFAKMIAEKPMLMTVINHANSVMYVDLSKPPNEDIEDDRPVSVRDALVFLELAVFLSEASVEIPGRPSSFPVRKYLTPELPNIGEKIDAHISHVVHPDQFYAQLIGDEAVYLAQMMNDLQTTYNKDRGDLWSIFCPQRNMICVCQFSEDNLWYRAKVTMLPGRRRVEVQYVDFGNVETVSYYKLKKILDSFLILPTQAIQCSLADVRPLDKSNGWSMAAIDWFGNADKRKLRIEIVGVKQGNILEVVLYDASNPHVEEICINSELVRHDLAISTGPRSLPADPLPENLIQESPSLSNHIDSPITTTSHHASVSPPRQITKPKEATPTPKEMSPERKKAPDRKMSKAVKVSHCESPSELYVQLATAGEDGLDELMSGLQSEFEGSDYNPVSWHEMEFCAARYSVDTLWYRAQIRKILPDNQIEVFMVDYGYIDTLPLTETRVLANSDDQPHCFCIRCHLSDICAAGDKNSWSRTACEALGDVVRANPELYIVNKNEMLGDSLAVDLQVEEKIEGDALTPSTVEYISVSKVLVEKGLAIPIRRKSPESPSMPTTPDPSTASVQPFSSSQFQPDTDNQPTTPSLQPNTPSLQPTIPSPTNEETNHAIDTSNAGGDNNILIDKERSPENIKAETKNRQGDSGIVIEDPELSAQQSLSSGLSVEEDSSEAPSESSKPTPDMVNGIVDVEDPYQVIKYLPAPVPKSNLLEKVVPTYVGSDGTIFLHEVKPEEDPEGRIGYLLQESTPEKIVQDHYIAKQNRHRFMIPRDGNCLYRAFSEGIFKDQTEHMAMRKTVVNNVLDRWDDIAHLMGMSKEQYADDMAKEGTYGGEPEIHVICWAYNITAIVHFGGFKYPVQTRRYGEGQRGEVEVAYLSDGKIDGGHYDLVLKHRRPRNEIYEKWREERVRELKKERSYSDVTIYDDSILDQLMNHLQDMYNTSEIDYDITIPWQIGQACVARFTDDQSWYRAKITNVFEDAVQVLYIDFGNSERLSLQNLRRKVIMAEIPQFTLECKLHGIVPITSDGQWSTEVLTFIHDEIVNNDCTIMIKGEPKYGEPLEVDLVLPNQQDLGEFLCFTSKAMKNEYYEAYLSTVSPSFSKVDVPDLTEVVFPYEPMPLPDVGDLFKVSVTNMGTTPTQVSIQHCLEPHTDDPNKKEFNSQLEQLEQMAVLLNSHAPTADPLDIDDIHIGTACLGQYTVDDCWYRTEVLAKETVGEETRILALYVDYGTVETITIDRIRTISWEYRMLPAQSMRCEIKGLVPPGGASTWLPAAVETMSECIALEPQIACIKDILEGKRPLIELYKPPAEVGPDGLPLDGSRGLQYSYKPLLDCGIAVLKEE